MFEVGFTEIILILGIALLVLGPEKLPKLANQIGRWAGRARAMARQLRQQLDEEVTVISKEDFSPAVKRPPAPPAVTPPPPAVPEPTSAAPESPPAPADEPDETRPS
jgi:sec-independent protein translocase protein TatB